MINQVLISGTVQSSRPHRDFTDVQILVVPGPDLALKFLPEQPVAVRIPASVMPPVALEVGSVWRFSGYYYSNRRPWTLLEFVRKAAPGMEREIAWPVDINTVQHSFTYSYLHALAAVRLESDPRLNVVFIEGEVISRPSNFSNGRVHLRIFNFPDEPIAVVGDRQQSIYATVSLQRKLTFARGERLRISSGAIYTFWEDQSLAFVTGRLKLNVVWPEDFDPRQAKVAMPNLAIGADTAYEVESAKNNRREQPSVAQQHVIEYMTPEDAARYVEPESEPVGEAALDDETLELID